MQLVAHLAGTVGADTRVVADDDVVLTAIVDLDARGIGPDHVAVAAALATHRGHRRAGHLDTEAGVAQGQVAGEVHADEVAGHARGGGGIGDRTDNVDAVDGIAGHDVADAWVDLIVPAAPAPLMLLPEILVPPTRLPEARTISTLVPPVSLVLPTGPLGTAAVPVTLVPMKLPLTRLPEAMPLRLAWMSTPSLPLPEIRLPLMTLLEAWVPVLLLSTPLMKTPLRPLGSCLRAAGVGADVVAPVMVLSNDPGSAPFVWCQ